ncbi:hypothetical protein [Mesorhizobium sp. B2-1-5]|uniref:hypothetical protein n=1 Tax=Mesorhizobium sp. B2-1-5 TaxID=2589969 RepID=UPI00112E1226|nr:hypothetical protein [Mesorhizobium sp. B2-1-5]TPM94227.1 hypothetical protein FJ966_18340 [Mesorhizobium sp. B2-1-5]
MMSFAPSDAQTSHDTVLREARRLVSAGVALFASVICVVPGQAGQSFSCSFGEPACLDYGAVVCKSGATCVRKDSVCFDSYTCDYKGFVCKSKLDDVVDTYDAEVRKYNDLVDQFNTLNSTYEEVRSGKASALSDLNDAQSKARRLSDCVIKAILSVKPFVLSRWGRFILKRLRQGASGRAHGDTYRS